MARQHGALVVHKNGEIIGSGVNYMASAHTSCHAEVAAINSVRKKDRCKLKEATLIVVRVGHDHRTLKLSKPCASCTEFIEKIGIRRVFYS